MNTHTTYPAGAPRRGGSARPLCRRGISTIYLAVLFVALAGFVSLAVDLGRVQLAKTQLQAAADGAARAAVTGLCSSVALAEDRAIEIAASNLCDGLPVALDRDQDIELGTWQSSSGTFTPLYGSARLNANAVRIRAHRTAGRNNAIPLLFARLIGRGTCDINASAIATIAPGYPWGFIGLSGVKVQNNLVSMGYDSSIDPNPTRTTYNGSGLLGSNGTIQAMNNEVVGTCLLGSSGSHNLTLAVPAVQLWKDIPAPSLDFGAAPKNNPANTPQDLTVTGTRTLPGGTYSFTKLTLRNNALLTFSGPATVYINGSVNLEQGARIYAQGTIPANLIIRQKGNNTVFGGPQAINVDIVAAIDAPQTACNVKNVSKFRGRATFGSIDANNDLELFYDRRLTDIYGTITGGGEIVLVK